MPEGGGIHSLRHGIRDRLRAVQGPTDIIVQIGGRSTAGVWQAFGEGYSIKVLHKWLCKAC